MFGELLDLIGVGMKGSIGISLTLGLAALYVYRAAALAKLVGALFGTLAGYAVMLCVAAAVAVGLGWVDPNVGVIMAHVGEALATGLEAGGRAVRRIMEYLR